jgi:hypothetical protein
VYLTKVKENGELRVKKKMMSNKTWIYTLQYQELEKWPLKPHALFETNPSLLCDVMVKFS